MGLRERRVAQIVRDFMEAYVLSKRICGRLRSEDLEFAWIERLVGDAEESVLYRLKEECHALFRLDGTRSRGELNAEELFDLAMGALFHEGMKFRESYYLTTAYGPRLERMLAEGSASGPLAEAFRRLFEAGRRRMLESECEVAALFRETRHQLLILLQQMPPSGTVARSLVEDPERTEAVFELPLSALLDQVYRSSHDGFKVAVESLIENGHYAEAVALLTRAELGDDALSKAAESFAQGMADYYAGNPQVALDSLSRWISDGAYGPPEWRTLAQLALSSLAANPEGLDPALERSARTLTEALTLGRSE